MDYLTSIAIATTYYDKEKNYFDSYFPFILLQFSDNRNSSISSLSTGLLKRNLDFPIHSLKTVITEKKNYFNISKNTKDWDVYLSDDGYKLLSNLKESQLKLERRLNEFYSKCIKYIKDEYNKNFNNSRIKENINAFLERHLLEISVNIENLNETLSKINGSIFDKYFSNFLNYINENDSVLCDTFDLLWKGSVVWHELIKKNLPKKEFKITNYIDIYLDTNIVFSILGFHHPLVNKAANEFLELIKKEKIRLMITDDTIDEIHNLLDAYLVHKSDYYEIEVDTVFYYLKKNNYTPSKIEEFKSNFPKKLNEYSIIIKPIQKNTKYYDIYPEIFENILEFKKTQNNSKSTNKKNDYTLQKSTEHDASVITHILLNKKRSARNIEDVKALFLTNSISLFLFYKTKYKKYEKYPSVIMDSTLTNILYLKNPDVNKNLQFSQVLKAHCSALLVDNDIWQSYIKVLKELKEKDSINIEDFSLLVGKNQFTQTFLLNKTTSEIKEYEIEQLLKNIKDKENERNSEIKVLRKENKDIKSKTNLNIKDLEVKNEKLRKKLKEKYDEALSKYQKEKELYITKENNSFVKGIRLLLVKYIGFITCSVLLFICNDNINMLIDTKKDLSLYNKSISVILFIAPFLRSFIKHDLVLLGLKSFNKKIKNNIFITKRNDFEKKFEEKYPAPKIEDFFII